MASEDGVGSPLANVHAGTASDFIMRTLIMDFREHTKKKLDDLLKFTVADKVLLDEVFESDPKIQQQFNSLTNMSQYHPSIIVDSLLKWRRSQLTEITAMLASKDWKKMSKEEFYLIEERIRLAVEYIFARALIPILDSLTFHKATLGTAFCEELEDIAFSFFKAPKKSEEDVEDDSVLGNRKKIPTLYAKVIGILSETRFKSIYPRFLRATTDTPARSKKAIFVILGVRYVRFMVETPEGIELSMAFLNSLLKLFKAAQPIEVKQAISELIVRLLRLSICSISPNCDYTSWYNMLNELYSSHTYHPKKGKSNKEAVALIPMVTSILCSLRKSDFIEHYREWLSRLYNALKEYKTRTVALENILFVVEAFYLKIGNELQSALHLLLEEVGSIVLTYCTVKRPMAEKGDMLDIFVDMLHAMAQLSLSYTVDDVVLKLLAFTNNPTPLTPDTTTSSTTSHSLTGGSFLPFGSFSFSSAPNPYAFACEKVIIAVRAIVQLRHGETSTNEKTSKRLFSMPSKDLLTIVYNHMVQATQAPVPITIIPAGAPHTKDLPKEGSKDSLKDSSRDSKDSKDAHISKETSKDNGSRESIKDGTGSKDSKESSKDSVKDVKQKSEKSDKDKADKKDVAKASPKETSQASSNPSLIVPSSPAPIPMPPFYSNLASREVQLAALNPYWENVTTIWAQILLHLDSVLGHLLYSTSYKTLYDMIRPERDIIAIQLLQLLLQSIPTVVPKIAIPKLVSILSKYIIHLDKGIEEMSTGALTRLLIWRPEFRPLIISGLAEFATSLSHNRPDLVFTLLFKLGQLFKQWLEIIKPPFELPRGSHIPPSSAAELDNFPTTKIEGIALIFLCSPKSKIRLLALEILKSVRSVETLLRKSASFSSPMSPTSVRPVSTAMGVSEAPSLGPIRIMDIIDEAGPDIIRSLQGDSRYSLQGISVTVKTVERLAAKDSREDQWLWSGVLGELLRHFSLLQPEPALLAAYLIQSRMREVKPDDKEIPPEQEEMLYWWRNYITLECVILPPNFLQLLPPILASLGTHEPNHSTTIGATINRTLSNVSSPASSTTNPTSHHTISRELSTSSLSGSRVDVQASHVMLPKDIFTTILPYLRSNNDMLREASVLALQRVNFASAEVLAECMRSFEKEFQGDHSDKKRRQKRNRLRYEVTCIYTSIACSIHQTAICRNPPLRRHMVHFVTELHSHLKSNRNLFDMLQLRYQYCVIVAKLAEELHAGTLASRDFQQSKEEIALRRNAFALLSSWCSADVFQDEGTKKHLNSLLSPIKDSEKRKTYVNALREHIMILQFTALTAMSSCLLGPNGQGTQKIFTNDENTIFEFVDGFLRHPLDKVRLLARFMLESFLSGNIADPKVLLITLNKSYHVDAEIANQYFLCLVSLFPEDIIFACSEVVLLHLIVYMIGNADFHVRRAARELLLMLKSLTNSDEQWLTTVPFVVDSSLPENYERAQIDLSARLADFHPDSAPEMIAEMVIRLDTVSPNSKRLMLRSILPWIEKLEFHTFPRQVLDSLMENLLYVTMRYKQDFPREVEQLWTTVARTNRNLQVVIRELITIGMHRQNTEIIPLAKFVCIYLARTASKVVIDTLVAELSAGELPISSGRNTTTHSERNSAKRTATPTSRNGMSSLGGSQSNSQASMPSYAADIDLEESDSTPETERARAKSDASNPERGTERPRSQTMGERLVVPSREGRRGSTGSTAASGSSAPANLSESAGEIRPPTADSMPHLLPPKHSTKELEAKLAPLETPNFDPEPPSSVKIRRRRRRRTKESRNRSSSPPPFSNVGSSDDEDSSGTSTSVLGAHPFQKLIPTLQAPWGLTRAHFILTILAQLTYETSEQFRDHLPIIFQLAFLGIDFPNPLVYEHCRIILLNVIHSLIVLPLEQIDNRTWALQEKYSEALHLVEYLRANQGEPLWAHEDVTMKKPEIRSAGQLTSLIQAIIKAFSPTHRPSSASGNSGRDLAETWAAQALTWAVHGQSWHITGRSFQIYRALRPAITRDAQNDLLECLLRSLSSVPKSKRKSSSTNPKSNSQTKENLALTIEVLITLQTLVRAQSAQKLILFPQMFWTAVALLQTDYEQHYLASLKLLSDLLDRLDFSDPYVQNIFSASVPKEWNPPFRGIQLLVARGLYSPMTEAKAIEVLSKLILIPFDRVLHPEPGRLLHLITCLLPYVCSNMRNTSGSHGTTPKRQSAEIAAHFSQACTQHRLPDLSRIFAKLSRFEYETMEEFLIEFKRPFGNALVVLQRDNDAIKANSSLPVSGTPKRPLNSIKPSGLPASNQSTSLTATTSTTNSGQAGDEESSMSDSADSKHFFRLESALSILFNMLEYSSSSWRRATLLIILALLQHRYPPPQQPVQPTQGGFVSRMMSSRDTSAQSRVSTDQPKVPTLTSPTEAPPRLSVGAPPESLERVMQPSWLVTLLKQMSSSSWQQALLVLDLALQHSAITVSELDPFVLKSPKSVSSSANTSPGASPIISRDRSDSLSMNQKIRSSEASYFYNRSSTGVTSASLALDKILSTEHRKRNLTLDSSLLSMFDGWYTKETTIVPPKSIRKKLSAVAEIDSDIDESISTEDQISYLLQTEPKGSGTKSDPFDAIATPVPASTLGRFPTFRGFDELLSKLESMPATPMTTLDSKPSGLFSDLETSSAASSSTVVIRKSSSKKLKTPIKLHQSDITSSETTETLTDDARSPRKHARSSRSSSSRSSDSEMDGKEARSSNSYKFRMGLEPRGTRSMDSVSDSQADSSANEPEVPTKHKTPAKSSSNKLKKSETGSGGSTPPTSRKLASSSPRSSAPLSDPAPRSPTQGTKIHAATFRPSSANKRSSPSTPSSSAVKRSKTSTPKSASSKYPSGASDEAPTSPVGSTRLKKLEFSFSSELLTRTKRWRSVVNREFNTEPSNDDLPSYFKIFSSAAKLLTSIRADFRSCLTFYCRLVVPTNRSWTSMEKSSTYDPGAPHRALSELLGRMTPEFDHVVPKIPELMLGMMPLRYKRVLKRDLAFASGFRDQRTKFIDDVKQCHLSYTEQRVTVEKIKSHLQEVEYTIFEEDVSGGLEKDEQSMQADKLAMEFSIGVLQLHIITLQSLLVQVSVGPIVAPLLESYSNESASTAKETVETEMSRSRALIQNLQHNLLTLN